MKLLRYGPPGRERPAMLDADGQVRDVSAHVADLAGATVSLEALDRLRGIDPADLPLVAEPGRIGSCLASVPNFFCIGLNYARHAAELNPTQATTRGRGSRPAERPTGPLRRGDRLTHLWTAQLSTGWPAHRWTAHHIEPPPTP